MEYHNHMVVKLREQPRKYRKHPCAGCVYWRSTGRADLFGEYACLYCFDTGKRRLCPPGKACTRRQTQHSRRRWANDATETLMVGTYEGNVQDYKLM